MNKVVRTRPDTEHGLSERWKAWDTFRICLPMEGMDVLSAFILGNLVGFFPSSVTEVNNDIVRILQESRVRSLEKDKPRLKYQLLLAHSLT